MSWLLIGLALLAALVWAVTRFHLRGEELGAYDRPRPQSMSGGDSPSPELLEAERHLLSVIQPGPSSPSAGGAGVRFGRGMLGKVRATVDQLGRGVEFEGEILPVAASGVRGEWLVPRDADPGRRLLYIHGGGFMVGSPLSHRAITTRYAGMIGGPVLSLDYRMSPEHRRRATLEDCRLAYRWLLDNSHLGRAPADAVFVSGDSAGGNLSLSLSAWIRDSGLRAPNAVVALSPLTDASLGSPSLRGNLATDKMLGLVFGKLARVPDWALLWAGWLDMRITPADPRVSPVRGELGGLPPTLVHASETEMLFDDAVRYVNKARASGSPAELQTWNHVMHVWHLFHATVPESRRAMREIEAFLRRHGAPGWHERAA